MKIKMKMKHWSSRYDINRPWPRHGHIFSKYKKCLRMMILFVIRNTWATFEAQFMKNLSNTEARMKKSVAYLRWTLRSETISGNWRSFKNNEKCFFYLTLKALFVFEIFHYLFWIFDHVGKWLAEKARKNFKIYDIAKWITCNCNAHIAE